MDFRIHQGGIKRGKRCIKEGIEIYQRERIGHPDTQRRDVSERGIGMYQREGRDVSKRGFLIFFLNDNNMCI